MKDVYTIVSNPNNYIFKHEVWIKGTVQDTVHGVTMDFPITHRVASYRKENKAKEAVVYWKELQQFKGE